MDASSSVNTTPFHRGFYCFGNYMNNYSLIFIHDLNSWFPSNLMAKVISKIPNYNEIIPYVKKLFSPRYGSYFIIRVNKHKNDLKFFDVLKFLKR